MDMSPAAFFWVIACEVGVVQLFLKIFREGAVLSIRDCLCWLCRRPRGWVFDKGLKYTCHSLRLDIALQLCQLYAVSVKDDGSGPAIVFVAARDIRAGIVVNIDRYITRG